MSSLFTETQIHKMTYNLNEVSDSSEVPTTYQKTKSYIF